MEFKKKDNFYIIRLNKGEKLIETLLGFLEKENIKSGSFNGLGAVSSVELGHYDLEKKEYAGKEFKGKYEIVSYMGNISRMDNKPYVHSHIVIADRGWKAFGGHCKEAVVGATCEIVLFASDMEIGRKLSDEIGLNLIEFT